MDVTASVPLVPVLGSLLFSLFINDLLATIIKTGKVHLFADDVQLYHIYDERTINVASDHINLYLTSILKWSEVNSLTRNPRKSQPIIFSLSILITNLLSW